MEVDLRRLLRQAPARADRQRREPRAVAPKIAVIGATGSGKTTLARRLAARLGVPHVELDALHWGPNWSQAVPEDFRARVHGAIASDGWVVDGNYSGKLGHLVLEEADAIVWLDPPLRTILRRLVRRTLARIRTREELWSGNRETWRNALFSRESLFLWAIKTHRRFRRRAPHNLERFDAVRLRSPAEVEAWLEDYVKVRM